MTDVIARPTDAQNIEIIAGEQGLFADNETAIVCFEYFKANGHSVRVELNGNGYHVTAEVENKALELAGLSSFQAAKQTSKGFVEF